ncbi:uncharacterized protein LOC115083964 [Rhinatrema bivittatum]|uniref:uncharacterized protein LOC115083964 n=1 Tax=Rhinatrema bivittatum TaxID=194408 RepID=UPI00112811B7|nr:uncharacterized protein LOC115083964 [Rhinatrema bivittatum]
MARVEEQDGESQKRRQVKEEEVEVEPGWRCSVQAGRSPLQQAPVEVTGPSSRASLDHRQRIRDVRFTPEESELIMEGVIQHYPFLYGKEPMRRPRAAKNEIWRSITADVCRLGVASRSVEQCQHRYRDIRQKLKWKVSEIQNWRLTGGGRPCNISLTRMEERLQNALGLGGVKSLIAGLGISEEMAGPRTKHPLHGLSTPSVQTQDIWQASDSSTEEVTNGFLEKEKKFEIPSHLDDEPTKDTVYTESVLPQELQWSLASSSSTLQTTQTAAATTLSTEVQEQDTKIEASAQEDPQVPTVSQESLAQRILVEQANYTSMIQEGLSSVSRQIQYLREDVGVLDKRLATLNTTMGQGYGEITSAILQLTDVVRKTFQTPQPPSVAPSATSTTATTRSLRVRVKPQDGKGSGQRCSIKKPVKR